MRAPDSVLEFRGVVKRFGGISALNEVDFVVPRGQIVGLIGPNGAGKTTAFNLASGAYTTTAGDIIFEGRSTIGLKPYQVARRGIARTFQNIRLFRSMTVWEHLVVSNREKSRIRNILPFGGAGRETCERSRRILDLTGLTAFHDRLPVSLPYGMQRKVEIARALASQPRLLLLDEPVAGMNQDEAGELLELLLRLRREGLTILVIEHDMPFVMNLCDHIYVLDFGLVIAGGRPEEVRRDPVVLSAYLGEDGGCSR